MGVDLGGTDIRVAEQFLDPAQIATRLQQMAGKAVAKRMGRCALWYFSLVDGPLDCFLDMGLVEIVASVFIFIRNECQRLCRKKPLPDEFSGSIFKFYLNST